VNTANPTPLKISPVGSAQINQLMPLLLAAIHREPVLRQRLFQVEFLTTLSGQALVTLVYHKKLKDDWREAAQHLHQALDIAIVGRSRGQKEIIDRDYVTETLQVGTNLFITSRLKPALPNPTRKCAKKC
jgi:tRNA (uracil-5-)-methyltransferase